MSAIEYDDEYAGERKWKIHIPFEIDFSKEYFEDLAKAYESGEVRDGFTLHIPGSLIDSLGPDLVRRLGPLLVRA